MEKELPNKDAAVVEDKKMLEYLLCLDHKAGGSKAKFFIEHGFGKHDLESFRLMLLEHGSSNTVVKIETNAYATKYIIEGPVEYYSSKYEYKNIKGMPDLTVRTSMIHVIQKKFKLRTVWSIAYGTNIPKLVTAYPIN